MMPKETLSFLVNYGVRKVWYDVRPRELQLPNALKNVASNSAELTLKSSELRLIQQTLAG